MRTIRLLAPAAVFGLLVAFPSGLAAQVDPDKPVAGGGTFPPGWNVRTERNAPLANVKFVRMGSGYHVTLGPAAIFWRDADTVSGSYHLVATFTQTKAPQHPESYGLLLGGGALADATQRYTYFLVRSADGMYSIRRRTGYAVKPTAVVEWTASDAVVKADGAGKATNELRVAVEGDEVRFLVNGKEVYRANTAGLDTQGIVGYRVNHNLDVHLSALGVHKF